MRSDK